MDMSDGLASIKAKLGEGGNQLLYAAASGSHAWGLSRPDSDIDIRGIYLKPTWKRLGLNPGRDTIEFSEGIYDVQLYELEKFLRMLCNHNGNMVNLLWLPDPHIFTIWVPWMELARSFLTKKLRHYYRGYAESQRKRAMSQRGGKALVYTYREILSGIICMHFGYMEHDFQTLWETARKMGWYSGGLLDKYFLDWNQEVSDEGWRQFYAEWEQLCQVLDREAEISKLPDTFDGWDLCNQILLDMRLSNLG